MEGMENKKLMMQIYDLLRLLQEKEEIVVKKINLSISFHNKTTNKKGGKT